MERSTPGFTEQVSARSLVHVLEIADYNPDGWAAEFVLQIAAGPCFDGQGVLFRLSRRIPRLPVSGRSYAGRAGQRD